MKYSFLKGFWKGWVGVSEICNMKIQMHIKYRKILVEFWYCNKFIYDTDFKLIIIPLFHYVRLLPFVAYLRRFAD